MSVSLTLTVDRTSLGMGVLTIESAGYGNYCLTPGGYTEPETTPRLSTARSPFVHGDLVTGSVLDSTGMVLEVFVQGNSVSHVEALADSLRDAMCLQLSYTITRDLDGVVRTYTASPAGMTRTAPVRKGDVMAAEATYTLTIPVYPIPGVA